MIDPIPFSDRLGGSYELRAFRGVDSDALARLADNRNVWAHLRDAFPSPYTLADARSWIEIACAQRPGTSLAIANRESLIGGIGVRPGVDVHSRTAELGYWLGEPFWGCGIMSNAVAVYADWIVDHFDLLRLFATPFDNNPASRRVLEKAGFELEGVLRKSAVKDGAVRDMLMYARVAEAGEEH